MFAFEKLDVYKEAFETNRKIYEFLLANKNIQSYVKNQLGRAALSIMLNIAEGSAKFSSRDRRNYLIISRGSAFECSAIINFLYDVKLITADFKSEMYQAFENLSRKLYTMIRNLEK